jgi:hypothetical protein
VTFPINLAPLYAISHMFILQKTRTRYKVNDLLFFKVSLDFVHCGTPNSAYVQSERCQ